MNIKSFLILSLLISFLILVGCNQNEVLKPVEPTNQEENKEEETKIVSDFNDDYDIVVYYINYLKTIYSYEIEETGATVASSGSFSYTQNITSSVIKNNEEYTFINDTSSLFVNNKHEAHFKGDNVSYKNSSDDDFIDTTFAEYKNKYGATPKDISLFGAIITKEAVKSINKTYDEETKRYSVEVNLDGNIAGTNMKIQAKEFGSLSEYPTYNSLVMTFVIDESFVPYSATIQSNYNISVFLLGEMVCNQTLNETFKNIKITGEENGTN